MGDPCFGGPKNIPMLLHHWYGGIERGSLFFERKYLASFERAYQELYTLLSPEMRTQVDHDRDLAGVISPYLMTTQPFGFLAKLQAANIRLKAAHLI